MKKYLVILGLFLFLGLVGAEYNINLDDSSFGTLYPQGGFFSGHIQVSFENQSLDSLFSDSEGNEFTLKQVLEKNPNFVYSCKNGNCESSFAKKSNNWDEETFHLEKGDEIYVGLIFEDYIEWIDHLSFNITSDYSEDSNESQIKIDFFDDGEINMGNTKMGNEISENINYGCFDGEEDLSSIQLVNDTFCQRIELEEAPGIMAGAFLEKTSSGDVNITMELYDSTSGILLNDCLINETEIETNGNFVSCEINYSIPKKEDYYICLNSNNNLGEYKIKGYFSSNSEKTCGFNRLPPGEEKVAYSIGVQKIYYGPVGTIEISNEIVGSDYSMGELIKEYIENEYGSTDCSQNLCYVPFKISSFENQEIIIDSIYLEYEALAGLITEYTFFQFEKKAAEISSTPQKLYLNNIFKLPSTEGKMGYTLTFDDKEIFDQDIIIQEISINLHPLTAAANFPITFEINFNPQFNFTNYRWDFGDNTPLETSKGNKKSHIYSSNGTYDLNVIATTIGGEEFSKSFEIEVGSPETMIQNKINETESKIEKIKNDLLKLGTFEKEEFTKRINIDEIETNLSYIKDDFSRASTNEDYKLIIDKLFTIRLPQTIIQMPTNKISFYSQKDNVNLNVLELIEEEQINNSEETINSILFWEQQNINSKISMNNILVKWDSELESFFRTFELTINPIYSQSENFYFIIKKIDDLYFKDNISLEEAPGYKYLPINKSTTLEFSTTGAFDFTTIPMFISPQLEKIKVEEIEEIEEQNRGAILVAILILLLIIGIAAYIFLQQWYKNKYEKYLFKERNQLYNVATYIHNAKDNDVPDSEIKETLEKAGWNNEQITYALRKYAGKRTGMYELPIKKLLKKKEEAEKEKKKQEQVKKQQEYTKFNKGY
jgi:PKD repeat protein